MTTIDTAAPVRPATRVRAADLREATRKTAHLRADSENAAPVYLDVEVLIARDTASAFAALAAVPDAPRESPTPLRYIGTARGLAGLIADVQRLGIADAVVLLPLADCPVEALMLEELAPGLAG
ncbi:hypothetical protein CIW49_27945 [Mycolicibacterium sp. P1-18]|uniref:hypothetical protein n=1 Tax=Mycolicibacterium sp. P1-18 TaxID=2024615 RepID=UPI0011F13A36|nr:hypothetical protein [Mycolicibacterium sp. P1-18]KAA0092645.1 hypothetical protein CIW49_27945 [Mycolicibacterium sp. P1-18]